MAGDQKLHRLQPVRLRLGQRQQRHLEPATGQAQALHRLGDGARQRAGGARPLGADALRFGLKLALGLVQGSLQCGGVGGGVECPQFGLPLRQQRGQLVGRAVVAPGQAHPGRQAVVQLGQARRIKIGAAEVGVQTVRGVLQLRQCALQRVDDGRDAGVVVGHSGQRRDGAVRQRVGRDLRLGAMRVSHPVRHPVRHAVKRAAGRVHQRLGVGQALVLGRHLGPFAVGRRQFVQLADLPGQALTLTQVVVTTRLGLGQRVGGGFAGCKTGRQAGAGQPGLGVQQRPGGGRAGQALPGMLAVDVEQVIGGLTQLAGGGRAAVDPGPALAVGVDAAAQQQARLGGFGIGVGIEIGIGIGRGAETALVQPAGQRRRAVELGTHIGPGRALSHHGGVGPAAQGQLQRIDQDGFAGARLPGQHREAGMELQLQGRHDHKIAQG